MSSPNYLGRFSDSVWLALPPVTEDRDDSLFLPLRNPEHVSKQVEYYGAKVRKVLERLWQVKLDDAEVARELGYLIDRRWGTIKLILANYPEVAQ